MRNRAPGHRQASNSTEASLGTTVGEVCRSKINHGNCRMLEFNSPPPVLEVGGHIPFPILKSRVQGELPDISELAQAGRIDICRPEQLSHAGRIYRNLPSSKYRAKLGYVRNAH